MLPSSDARYAQRRIEVIYAAADIFAERGYHGASTQLIADRLGMRQGSLYYYLSSKEEALEEVCLVGVQGALALMEEELARVSGVGARIQAIVRAQLHGLYARCVCWIVFHEQRQHLSEERRARVSTESLLYRQRVQQVLTEGVAQGELRADLDSVLAARALLGLCHSVASWYVRKPDIDLDHVAQEYARLFYAGTRAADTAGAEPLAGRYSSHETQKETP